MTMTRSPQPLKAIPHPSALCVLSGNLPIVSHLLFNIEYLFSYIFVGSAVYKSLFTTARSGGAAEFPPPQGHMFGISVHPFFIMSYTSL